MSHASIVIPYLPALDPDLAASVRRAAWAGVRAGVRATAFVAGSVAAAALVWLVLAGPGFVSDHASTVPHHTRLR